MEKPMIRFIALAFAFAVTSAQAMSPAPLHQPDGMITQVREACGAVCTWSMVSAFVLLPAGTPPGVQLECIQWVAVALRIETRLNRPGRLNLLGRSAASRSAFHRGDRDAAIAKGLTLDK